MNERSENVVVSTDEQSPPPKKPMCSRHKVELTESVDCSRCGGEGVVEDMDDICSNSYETCWECHGSGTSPWLECWLCLEEDQDEY